MTEVTRRPVDFYIYRPDDHAPLDAEGLAWLADQLCSEDRVHPDRTMASGWITTQAAYEFPALVDTLATARAEAEAKDAEIARLRGASVCEGIDLTGMTHGQREQVIAVLAGRNAEIERLSAELHAAIHQAQEWRAKLTEREAEIEQLEDDLCDKNNTYHNAWQDARIENDRLKEQRDALALQAAEWEGKYAIVSEQVAIATKALEAVEYCTHTHATARWAVEGMDIIRGEVVQALSAIASGAYRETGND